jgi:hypothetical protein
MAPSCDDVRCIHCGADVSANPTDDWCNECGKRIPSFVRDAAKSKQSLAPSPARVVEDEGMRRQRLVCGGVILALVGLMALAFIPNLF